MASVVTAASTTAAAARITPVGQVFWRNSRQGAQSRREALHLRRADGRRGRRREGGNLSAAGLPTREGRRRHHGLVLPAGGLPEVYRRSISPPTPCTSFGPADSS